ncbi:MAG: endonuclease III [Lentisphaerae bacterium]|jgi:endonuclease-3|nr:endonuclease III [Lentisphaerota bacterium]
MKRADIPEVHRRLMLDFKANPAPIIDLIGAQGFDPFKILVATILSARTRDETTSRVISEKLFPAVKKYEDLRDLSVEEIEQLIYPVGFYRQKAAALKKLPDVIDDRFSGKIPDTVEELCELPGVGRKTANLVVAVAFDKPAICVDVHVHRINNRLGLISTKNPESTEMALREILPLKYWKTWNACFVSFGQRKCTPLRPKCSGCIIGEFCAYNQASEKPS